MSQGDAGYNTFGLFGRFLAFLHKTAAARRFARGYLAGFGYFRINFLLQITSRVHKASLPWIKFAQIYRSCKKSKEIQPIFHRNGSGAAMCCHGFVQNLQKSIKKSKIIVRTPAVYPPALYAGNHLHLKKGYGHFKNP